MSTLRHAVIPTCIAALCALAACAPTPARTPSFQSTSIAKTPRLDMTWREQVQGRVPWSYYPQEYSTPTFVERKDDLIVGSTDGTVTRMRAGSGEVVWRKALTLKKESGRLPVHAPTAVTDDGIILAATLSGSIHALDYSDGTTLWTHRVEDAVESPMAMAEGRLFVTDSREILYALDVETGKLLWRYQRRAPEFFTIKGAGTPVVDGDAIYCGFADGTLVAVQIDTGEVMWSRDLTNEEAEFVDVDMPAIIAGDSLYVASYAGGVYALSRRDGATKWRADLAGVAQLNLYDGLLYAASAQGRVVAIDPVEQQYVWSYRYAEDLPVELIAHGPYLFVSTSQGPLTVFDRFSGKPLMEWNPSNGFHTPVVFHQQRGFLLSNGGFLYAFELAY